MLKMTQLAVGESEGSIDAKYDTQYTAVLHVRCSVMWCLRYGGIVC